MTFMPEYEFYRLYTLFQRARAFFVVRANDHLKYEEIQVVRLTGYKSSKSYPEEFRLVVYKDYATITIYYFMTKDSKRLALSIGELYWERLEIEIFFK